MKINTIVDIFRGTLLNTPYISYVNEIKTNINLVKYGDLFIAENIEDIPLAIEKKAYLRFKKF